MRGSLFSFLVFVQIAGCASPKLVEPTVERAPAAVPAVPTAPAPLSRVEGLDVAPESAPGMEASVDPPRATLVCEARVHVVPASASFSGRRLRVFDHDVEGCGRGSVRARLVNRTQGPVKVTEATVSVSRAARSVEGFAYWLDWVLAPGESRSLSVPVREPGTLVVSFRAEDAAETTHVAAEATIERVQVVVER